MDFNQSSTGHLRPSDLGGSYTFEDAGKCIPSFVSSFLCSFLPLFLPLFVPFFLCSVLLLCCCSFLSSFRPSISTIRLLYSLSSNYPISNFLYYYNTEMIGFGERVERPPDLKNLTGHLEKRKAFTLDENVRKSQRKEEINAKRQKKLDLREGNKEVVAAENDGFGTEMDESEVSTKITGAQKRENRARLGR
jgi:hypothetical protein